MFFEGLFFACKNVEVVDQTKKKHLHAKLVFIVSFTLCYQQEELFDSFQAETSDPSNDDKDKGSWILYHVPTTADSFDITALEDIKEYLHMNFPSSQSRFTGYLERIANEKKENNHVNTFKFENMIFHYDKFHADDIKEKGLTPHVISCSKDEEIYIHITYEIPIYDIDKLHKKGKKKTAMTPQ